jgi:hypothetical protein
MKTDFEFNRKIRLGFSETIGGRGIFATDDIKKGEIVESCPLVIMGIRMNYHIDPVMWSHMYTNTCPCDECKKHGGQFLMVLGYAQLYNHQDDNNASIKFDMDEQFADIVAMKDISKGSEIFINYGPKYFKKRPKIVLDELGKPVQDQGK